ncbi:TPA: hypothetical protein ACH3X2_012864 [Trebouxia sp. C0005]
MIARALLSNRFVAAVRTTSRCTEARNKTACTTLRTRPHETSMMQSKSCLHHHCATWCFGRAAYVVPPSPCHRSLESRTDPRRAQCKLRQHKPTCNAQQHRLAAHCTSVSSIPQTSETNKQNGAAPGFARRTSVKDVKGGPDKGVSNIGLKFDVRGWVRTVRQQKSISFIEVNDGSTLTGLQVLVDPDTAGYLLVDSNTINTGAAVRVQGELVESPARGQLVELKATAVYLIGECNQETYPLQKKRHSLPYLRSIPHLRPRTNTFGAVTRVRSALAFATHQFFRESGFQYIHTPILSASDCEGAGEMFQVTTLIGKHDEALAQGPVSEQDVHHLKERISKQNSLVSSAKLAAHTVDSQDLRDQEKQAVQQLKHLKQQVGPLMERVTHYRGLVKNQEGLTDYSQDFFGKPTFLTVSGQLNAEMYATAMSDVYTFGPTFRAENSNTSRHLAEFWMIEPEMAFADLSDDMNCAEAYLKHCLRYILDHCSEDLEFFARQNDKMLVQRLQDIVAKPFARLSYTDAVELLQKAKVKFTFPVNWGSDLQSEHERYLTETEFKGTPLFITDYPKDIKAFYMRVNSDDKTVAAMDLLVPGVGELIGGSQREERLQMLEQRIAQLGLNAQDYWWYLDLRRYGSVPHAGFGLGFERLVQFATGVENIRDVIPFPRYPGHCEF